jgi:hypothetical protein
LSSTSSTVLSNEQKEHTQRSSAYIYRREEEEHIFVESETDTEEQVD